MLIAIGPGGADDYSPGCQPGVLDEYIINSEGVAEETMAGTLTNLLVHIVFSTKGREAIITDKYQGRVDYDPKHLWDLADFCRFFGAFGSGALLQPPG